MENIRNKVNFTIFRVCLAVWVLLMFGLAIPGYSMATELKTLFATLTGVIIRELIGFAQEGETKGVTP